VLSQDEVRAFSDPEKRELGHKVGQMVAWIGKSMSFAEYDARLPAGPISLPDRVNYVRSDVMLLPYFGPMAGITATNRLLDVYGKFQKCAADGALEPTIIGHDDVAVWNMVFVECAGAMSLQGLIDFGVMKKSTPEREFRHLPTIGKAAVEAAVAAYKAETGVEPSMELIYLWATMQTVSNYTRLIKRGNRELAVTKRRDLLTIEQDMPVQV
jgi:hypothetical protein